jgi:hypothetical protein
MRSVVVGLGLVVSACVGAITDPGGEDNGGGGSGGTDPTNVTSFQCKPELTPPAVPLRRLTAVQITNTVSSLVASVLPSEEASILAALDKPLGAMPVDKKKGPNDHWGGFTRVDQNMTQEHVDRTYDLATAIGVELTSSPGRLSALAGSCATDGDSANDDACLDDFIRSFGEKTLRRAVLDEDVAFYRSVAGSPPFDSEDWADIVAQLTAAPEFLYFVENGDVAEGADPDLYAVTAYELASRLSYHFWQTMPDDELLGLARSGELLDPAVFEEQVDRLYGDPRTTTTIRQFFSEWLHRDDLAQLNALIGTPAYDAIRGDFTPTSELRQAMHDEVADMAMHYARSQPGTLDDIYLSPKSFARSAELAGLYGVPAWDGTSEPPDFTEPQRRGLLTRAAMVATGSANTRPIMKGVFIRRALLCDKLNPPPANVMATEPVPTVDATSREVVEALTANGVCPSCHVAQINPLGFATENFDALGRVRTEEMLVDALTGTVTGSKPLNTVAIPQVTPGDSREVADGLQLASVMLESGKPQACFARVYFRFTFGRTEDLDKDGCTLDGLHAPLKAGKPLAEVLRQVALAPAFRLRDFGDD